MHKPNWDDLRYVLAVADAGSVARAAKDLGVNHATVLRRVADFEARHGVPIFEKTHRGYRVLAERQDVIDAARRAESAMDSVSSLVGGQHSRLQGIVRVASTDTLCQRVLPRIAADLRARFDGVSLELLSANTHVDLPSLQVDVTVRPAKKLPSEIVGTAVAKMGFGVYAPHQDARKWLRLSGPLSRSVPAEWMGKHIKSASIIAGADSFLALARLAASMDARAVLPCFLGDDDPNLVRVPTRMPQLFVPIWVASHVDYSDNPRVRAIREHLGAALADLKPKFEGSLA